MKNMIRISVLAGLSMLSIASYSAMAGWDYKGHGGYRAEQGQGYAYYHQSLDHCKNTCDADGSCQGIEYISNPQGWNEPNQGWVNQKCEIHRETFTHCDTSFTGGKGAQDGCWVKTAAPPPPPPPPANNPNVVYFDMPGYNGTGCPDGSANVTMTPDKQTMTMIFGNYTANPDRKTCNISVPVHVPNGYQVSLLTADYEGFVYGTGNLYRKYFFAGQNSQGPTATDTFSSLAGDPFSKHDELQMLSNVWSECGKDVNLRINTSIWGRPGTNDSIAIDSLDLRNKMKFHLKYQECGR